MSPSTKRPTTKGKGWPYKWTTKGERTPQAVTLEVTRAEEKKERMTNERWGTYFAQTNKQKTHGGPDGVSPGSMFKGEEGL